MEGVVFAVAGTVGLLGSLLATAALAVQACPDPRACVQISVGSAAGLPGDTVTVGLTFQQGPNDGQAGGVDEIAALALSLGMGGSGSGTLVLADCSLSDSGLPNAIKPDPSLAPFSVVVQNVSCTSRSHCLCPDPTSGITPDPFINLAIYGPKLPPTPAPIAIPTLPTGQLLTIDLKIGSGASGTIPLRLFNASSAGAHPASTALLSLGDTLGVDQTCVRSVPTPPCSGPNGVSQVATNDGVVVVLSPPTATGTSTATPTNTLTPTPTATATSTNTGTLPATQTETPTVTAVATATYTSTAVPTSTFTAVPVATDTPTATPPLTPNETATGGVTPSPSPTRPCLGDCNLNGTVTVDEVLTMVSIALDNDPLSACLAGDADGDQQITVDEILAAVNHALNGCGHAS